MHEKHINMKNINSVILVLIEENRQVSDSRNIIEAPQSCLKGGAYSYEIITEDCSTLRE